MHACMCISLTPERLNGFYSYSVVKSLSILAFVPGKHDNSNFKRRGRLRAPEYQMTIFSNVALTILIEFRNFVKPISISFSATLLKFFLFG
jgi:hypothetical protein